MSSHVMHSITIATADEVIALGNKLFEIKPVIGQSQTVVRNIRQEEVVLARLRIGHTRITHSYLLNERSHRIVLDVMHSLQSAIFYLNVVIFLI